MTFKTDNEAKEAGDRFAVANLSECCKELLEMADTGILKNGKVRELATFFSFAGHHSLPLAESTVKTLALRQIVGSAK